MQLLHVLLDGAHALGIVDADAQVLVVVVHRAFVDVVQRQERQESVAAVAGLHLGVGREVAAQVAVAQHDALGHARGAAGVDHRRPVVGLDFALPALYFAHPFVAVGDAQLQDFQRAVLTLDVGQAVHLRLGFHLVQGWTDAIEQHLRAHHHGHGLAVAQDVEVALGVQRGIDGHMDDTAHGQGHVDEVPLRAVAAHGHHAVALFQAHLAQAVGQVVGKLVVVVRAVFHPLAVHLSGQYVILRIVLHQVVQQIEGPCNLCHIYFRFRLQKYTFFITWQKNSPPGRLSAPG